MNGKKELVIQRMNDMFFPKTIPEILIHGYKNFSNSHVIQTYYADGTIDRKTFEDLYCDSSSVCHQIKEMRLKSRLIFLVGNMSYQWIVFFFGIMFAGFIPVLIDNQLSDEDVLKLCETTPTNLICYEKEDIKHANMKEKGQNSDICFYDMNRLSKTVKKTFDFFSSEFDEDDTALIAFTSGTEGKAKAVMLSHKNICSDIKASYYFAGQGNLISTVALLPPYHLFELITGILTPLCEPFSIVLTKDKKSVLKCIKTIKPSILLVVPAVLEMLVRILEINGNSKRNITELFGNSLLRIVSGGVKTQSYLITKFKNWGIDVFEGYGITECSPVVCCNTKDFNKIGSVGKPSLNSYCSVSIDDDEICISGDIVMKGYYGESVSNQFFRTGDLGYLDSEGFLFITGRKKNLIILSNGEKVSPERLEHRFLAIQEIKDILVHTYKTINGIEQLCATVILKDEYTDSYEMRETVINKIRSIENDVPDSQHMKKVFFRNTDFVRSSTGKIIRSATNYGIQ